MSKVIPKTYYKCDICDRKADRHFKVKIPISETNLKKWERFDMCTKCYMEFYNKCRSGKDTSN